jgi:hypothetical protein
MSDHGALWVRCLSSIACLLVPSPEDVVAVIDTLGATAAKRGQVKALFTLNLPLTLRYDSEIESYVF